jgi:hypothetical protein
MILTTLLPIQSLIVHFLQTLTTLNLTGNQMGDQGAAHLANALKLNKVTSF